MADELSPDDIRVLFDAAVKSQEFGYGWIDDAEVDALRRVAVYFGLSPMEATPESFRTRYPHDFEPEEHYWYDDLGHAWHTKKQYVESGKAVVREARARAKREKAENEKHNDYLRSIGWVFVDDPNNDRRRRRYASPRGSTRTEVTKPLPDPKVLYRRCKWCGKRQEHEVHSPEAFQPTKLNRA
jgi:hypothetical protein